MLKILSGLSTNLPSEISFEHLYFTSDTQELYADINGSSRVRIGDILKVSREADLPTLSAEESNKFYYIKETNQLVTFNGATGKFEPVNNLESFGVTLSPEEINQLKTTIDDISSKIENGEIGGSGGGIDFSYNSGAYNTPGLNAGKENWIDFANISKGKIYQLTDIGLLNPGLTNENVQNFTLNDLNNYSTEMVFLDRHSHGTILNKPDTEPILSTIPTKHFTNWLRYAIGNDIESGKIDISEKVGKVYQFVDNEANSTNLAESLVLDKTENFLANVVGEDQTLYSLTDLNKVANFITYFNQERRVEGHFEAISIDSFLQWFSTALANDINNGIIKINLGSTEKGLEHYNSINDLFETGVSSTTGTANLADIVYEMKTPSIFRDFVTANSIDYPIDGILEIYKTADYTAQIKLTGGTNDLYSLSVNPNTWNEILPERPKS